MQYHENIAQFTIYVEHFSGEFILDESKIATEMQKCSKFVYINSIRES